MVLETGVSRIKHQQVVSGGSLMFGSQVTVFTWAKGQGGSLGTLLQGH